MNIVITGSLGHISKPLTQNLLKNGHTVTGVSSKVERKKEIEALGAKAAIGSLEDPEFLSATFIGADSVYLMTPPAPFFDRSFEPEAYYSKLGHNYAKAILESGVKHVVNLSSIGAHLKEGSGIIRYSAHHVENILRLLPDDVSIIFLRPAGFYYNFFATINGIKHQDIIAANYGGDDTILLVSPLDIASVAADEIVKQDAGRKILYIASEELTCNEVASLLGGSIGKPELKWIVIPNEHYQQILEGIGMAPQLAAGMVEMNAATHTGMLYEDYFKNRPELGKIKLKDFLTAFAAMYHQP